MLEKLHILITLIAAVVMAVYCVITDAPLIVMCGRLILTIVIFYFVGILSRHILSKQLESKKTEENEPVYDLDKLDENVSDDLDDDDD